MAQKNSKNQKSLFTEKPKNEYLNLRISIKVDDKVSFLIIQSSAENFY